MPIWVWADGDHIARLTNPAEVRKASNDLRTWLNFSREIAHSVTHDGAQAGPVHAVLGYFDSRGWVQAFAAVDDAGHIYDLAGPGCAGSIVGDTVRSRVFQFLQDNTLVGLDDVSGRALWFRNVLVRPGLARIRLAAKENTGQQFPTGLRHPQQRDYARAYVDLYRSWRVWRAGFQITDGGHGTRTASTSVRSELARNLTKAAELEAEMAGEMLGGGDLAPHRLTRLSEAAMSWVLHTSSWPGDASDWESRLDVVEFNIRARDQTSMWTNGGGEIAAEPGVLSVLEAAGWLETEVELYDFAQEQPMWIWPGDGPCAEAVAMLENLDPVRIALGAFLRISHTANLLHPDTEVYWRGALRR